ncbi:MAG: MFS transporter [Fimbriimonadales bacterium]|nr:MFS transporter [Fimbriimonadales bacterium]
MASGGNWRNIRLMGWTSFFADVSSEMTYPAIPLFLKNTLQAPASALGWTEGLSQLIIGAMAFLSGRRSDRTGRRTGWIRLGYLLAALGKPLMALAHVWTVVLGARAVDRIGKGLRTSSRDALLADSAGPGEAGKAFGFQRAMDNAGALVGSALAVLLMAALAENYRVLFLMAFVPGMVAVALTLGLRDLPQTPRQAEGSAVRLPRSKPFWWCVGLVAFFELANSSDAFLILRANDLGLAPAASAGAYLVFTLVAAASSYKLASLSDRVGRAPLIVAGWLAYAAVYLGMALGSAWTVWPLLALYGLYFGATDGVAKALVRDASEPEFRGQAMGVLALIRGVALFLGNLLAGWLWDGVGHAAPFLFGASVAAAASLAMLLAWRTRLLPALS